MKLLSIRINEWDERFLSKVIVWLNFSVVVVLPKVTAEKRTFRPIGSSGSSAICAARAGRLEPQVMSYVALVQQNGTST
jgi:hypothetical protein